MERKTITAFLDTMIYLHFKPVEEIPWTDLLGAQHVHIILPRITQRELDKLKDSHPQRKISERARRVLQQSEGWAGPEPAHLRDGVDAALYLRKPRIDFEEFDLDLNRNDDVMIATILDYGTQNLNAEVVLVTQDTTPRLMARFLGITSIPLSDEFALPAEPDPLEQENRELRKRVEKLERAMPGLSLRFVGGAAENRLHIRLHRPPTDPDAYIAKQIEHLRQQYPPQGPEFWTPLGDVRPAFAVLVPVEEYHRYNAQLEEFLAEYAQHLRDAWQHFVAERLTTRFQMELWNDGSAPAQDVDVHLHFPDGFQVVLADTVGIDAPTPPEPPVPPKSAVERMADQINSLPFPYYDSLPRLYRDIPGPQPPPNVTRPDIHRTQSHDVRWNVRRVKHKQCEPAHELAIIFDDYDQATSFQIAWRIHAANLPDEVEGLLHVKVEKEGEAP